jgi:hypothetical protein
VWGLQRDLTEDAKCELRVAIIVVTRSTDGVGDPADFRRDMGSTERVISLEPFRYPTLRFKELELLDGYISSLSVDG